jgi:uncharacterized protein (DUF433 family)
MHYYKRPWKQTSGSEQTGEWGEITSFFETNETYYPVRQLDVFANGNALKYDTLYHRDRNGALFQFELNPDEFEAFRITAEEFELAWGNTIAIRFPEIVHGGGIGFGQPRLDGRRLSVGDIISILYHDGNTDEVRDDFELSDQQVFEALVYCFTGQCLKDKPENYCHNCTHRALQDNEPPDEEQTDRWREAEQLLKTYI